jgi:DNA-binding GntR family transcriptional regulator
MQNAIFLCKGAVSCDTGEITMSDMSHANLLGRARRSRTTPAAIVRAKPLHESAAERLRDMIVEGRLAVGERLHEANLAAVLQVSRTPIREAIKLLATEGLVDLLPGRGARVSGFSVEQVRELFEAIAGVERNAAELAAERMTEREFDKLQRMHERMARHHAAGERQPYFRLNQEIHLAIVAAAKNATLQAIQASLISRARRVRYEALASQARWIEAMEEHERLMAALADRNGPLAGAIMQKHDLGTAAAMVAALEKMSPPDDAPER